MSDDDPEPRLRVAVFRPADERLADAVALLESLGATPVADPMLEVEPTGRRPREADYVVFTSKTGVEVVAGERPSDGDGRPDERGGDTPTDRWEPGDATVVAIGGSTAAALREHGYPVDIVPEEYSSTGLVDALAGDVDGRTVELARSDHGSAVLIEGLEDAGATVHETVLYRLTRPEGAGESAELAASGDLGAAIFTSSLTVEHFLDAAAERGVCEAALDGLAEAVVGAIGDPTRETAETAGIAVDVVPGEADFDVLACEVVETAAPTYHE
ncbi:MAG: uroporphyrinogen-III synthase [Haloarculaceae archaeon]